jgi:hypothetical protein
MNKNAIIYLVRTTNHDLNLLNTSIGLLKKNFIGLDKVDILIIHEKSLEPALDFVKSLHPNMKFQEIEFKIPDFYNKFEIPLNFPHPFVPGMSFSMGYRHMCRLFSGEIFKLPIIRNYENYLRLDTDSFIHGCDFDIFDFVEKNSVKYGYIEQAVQYDEPGVTKGLWDLAKTIKPDLDIEENKMYYTNFEICNVEWFNSKEYMEFYEKIDQSGGIMTGRWGDAPIRYLGVNMFMDKHNIHGFSNINYQHGSFFSHENNQN